MNEHHAGNRKRVIRRQYNLNNDSSLTISNPNQPANARKKLEGLICSVCEGPAHGYNFDTITCESCKAFFRRNALRIDKKFKCRSGNGQCAITVSSRKRCKACRLNKCFAQGMRSDWILTDEERMNKKRKIEENRRLRQMIYPDSPQSDKEEIVSNFKLEPCDYDQLEHSLLHISAPLSSNELALIERIQQAYNESVRLTSLPPEVPSYPHTALIQAPSDMMNLPTNLQTTRLITFFKLLPEIASLNEHDKLILVKYSAFSLVFIRSALIYDRITDSYYEQGTDDCVFAGKDLIQCFSLHQYEQSTRCVCQLINASRNDRLIIQILLIITLLSKGSTPCVYLDESEPIVDDIKAICQLQNQFIELLWKYCENKFGYFQSIDIFLKLVIGSMNAHLQAFNTRYNYFKNDVVADELVPLMKSVILNI